jgi:hypothetical protein
MVCLRAQALGAIDTIPIDRLGQPGDETSYGSRPSLNFFLPVFRSVRSIHFRAIVRVSPAVDARSTVTVVSGGTPQFSESVDAVRRNPVIDVNLPLPRLPQRTLDVSVTGAFAHVNDDVCSRFDPASLYLIVDRASEFVVDSAPPSSVVAEFLQTYDANVAIVVPPGTASTRRLAAIGLGYELKQLYRWRHADIALRTTLDPTARNIVLGNFQDALAVRGNQLDVGPQGDALLGRQIEPLLMATTVESAQLAPAANPPSARQLSLFDLGMTTQTQTGEHPAFSLPFNTGPLDGLPTGLRLNATLAHTALSPDERATVSISINGALVDSLPLAIGRGRENVEVAIPSRLVASANDVRLSVDYDPARDCRVAPPSFTTTLLDDSFFSWDGVTTYTFSVGEFFRSASGRVVVLVDGDQLIPYAFSLVSMLGDGNPNVTSLDVLPFAGTIPSGYNAAIVVAPLERLSQWSIPLAVNGASFALGEGAPPLTARYDDGFGVLESARIGATQTLIASYWKDPGSVAQLDRFGYETVASQTGRVFMFQGQRELYASTAPRVRVLPEPFLVHAWLPVGAGAIVLLAGVIFIARRQRVGGKVT